MKKIIVTSFALLTFTDVSYAAKLTYSSYRIFSDGPYIDQKNPIPVAYIITSYPTIAILVFPGGISTIVGSFVRQGPAQSRTAVIRWINRWLSFKVFHER